VHELHVGLDLRPVGRERVDTVRHYDGRLATRYRVNDMSSNELGEERVSTGALTGCCRRCIRNTYVREM
jgi:hypothetical protein